MALEDLLSAKGYHAAGSFLTPRTAKRHDNIRLKARSGLLYNPGRLITRWLLMGLEQKDGDLYGNCPNHD